MTHGPVSLNTGLEGRRNDFVKVCAKFNSGIKFGIGFVLERSCATGCSTCGDRNACRNFNFRPHYDIKLVPKLQHPTENVSYRFQNYRFIVPLTLFALQSPDDSFVGFRSSFIHMSTSLTSTDSRGSKTASSIFHLTPKVFTHFWSWWGLFDRSLSLPVRQGKLFPNARPPSKKFGQHLATLKVSRLMLLLYADAHFALYSIASQSRTFLFHMCIRMRLASRGLKALLTV